MKSKNIVKIDHRIKEHIEAASKLHSELLPDSPIPRLGWYFMTKFYYHTLIKNGLIICDLYKYKGKFVGLLSYTKYPFSFMKKGKDGNFLWLLCILLVSLFAKPSRLKILLDLLKVRSKRNSVTEEHTTGEFLSFGVLKPYRHILDEETGLRISELLFQNGINFFRYESYKKVMFSIIKKKGNKDIFVFYEFYGVSFNEDIKNKTGFKGASMGIYDLTRQNERFG